ncbi:MAG: hypothetical protein ACOZAR_00120 [Patescibacteria group bacterium]
MKTANKFAINPTNEFHILRHYKYVDELYKKTLIGQPYWYYDHSQKKFLHSKISQTDIENALQTIGTKFSESVIGIENPRNLLKIIKSSFQKLLSSNKIDWTDNIEHKSTAFAIDFQFHVGQMNCLNFDDISQKNKARIRRVPRSKCVGENKIFISTISDIKLSSTKTIHVEIVETKQLPFFVITAFPNCPLTNDMPEEKLVFVV